MLIKKGKYLAFFLVFICMSFESVNFVKSSTINKLQDSNSQSIKDNFYILGPGDEIEINFVGAPELTNKYLIMSDGNIQLPILGSTNLSGLTLDNAEQLINLYQNELIRPEIYLNLIRLKPLKVSVIGEILRPGPYTLTLEEINRVRVLVLPLPLRLPNRC